MLHTYKEYVDHTETCIRRVAAVQNNMGQINFRTFT